MFKEVKLSISTKAEFLPLISKVKNNTEHMNNINTIVCIEKILSKNILLKLLKRNSKKFSLIKIFANGKRIRV